MTAPDSAIAPFTVAAMVAIARTAPHGRMIEVGVYKGGSAWHLAEVARERGVSLHLFDTFSGMPFCDPEDENDVGKFGDTSLEAVRAAIPDAVFHVGLFPDTIPADFPADIAFIHCDCDQYRSVRAVLDRLWPLVIPGGLIVFDDMDTAGGRRAIGEVFGDHLSIENDRHVARKPA